MGLGKSFLNKRQTKNHKRQDIKMIIVKLQDIKSTHRRNTFRIWKTPRVLWMNNFLTQTIQ